jgi:hypothetical protein
MHDLCPVHELLARIALRLWSVSIIRELKLTLSHYTPRTRLGERKYSSYSFSTSALDGGERSASHPGRALPPVKGLPTFFVREAGWASEPVWTQRLEEKSFHPCRGSNLDCPVVQSTNEHIWKLCVVLHRISRFQMLQKCYGYSVIKFIIPVFFINDDSVTTHTLWSRSSCKCYLRIQSVPQREHHTSPLKISTG